MALTTPMGLICLADADNNDPEDFNKSGKILFIEIGLMCEAAT
jgi:hypothetical protein